nr:glycosyltransferase family 92 protein [uncultured Romboutsia sp.]
MIKEVYDDIINLTLSIKSSIKKERNLLINNNLSINIVANNVQKIITEFKQYLEEYSCLKNNPIIDILNKYNDDLLHIINEDNKDNVLIILDNITDSLLDKVQENIIVKDDILSLTLIVKNEAFYIKEWIEFHRMIGVTHFYIYDNESSDDLYKKLSSYISQGIVTYTYWPTKGVYSTRLEAQLAAYNDSLYKYKYDTKYMGFIDVDEFIVPVNRKNIIEVIDDIFYRYENCGGIGINWRVYGSSYNEKK